MGTRVVDARLEQAYLKARYTTMAQTDKLLPCHLVSSHVTDDFLSFKTIVFCNLRAPLCPTMFASCRAEKSLYLVKPRDSKRANVVQGQLPSQVSSRTYSSLKVRVRTPCTPVAETAGWVTRDGIWPADRLSVLLSVRPARVPVQQPLLPGLCVRVRWRR